MRKNLPAPAVAAILSVVALALGYLLWRASGPAPNAERTEALLKKAFGAKGGAGVSIPPPPGGVNPAAGPPAR